MKVAISLILFFAFYFVSLKDINDQKRFVEENNEILEYEMLEKDSIIQSLRRHNGALTDSIQQLNNPKPKKKIKFVKPIVTDTIKAVIPDTLN
jgi:hypothetical protein